MKLVLRSLLEATCFAVAAANIASGADTNALPRLTIDLRDGSRLVGESTDKFLRFHSELLGDLKLKIKDVRSVDCVSTNSAKLTTADGDSLAVLFVNPELAVKTGFGKIELPVDSIRKFSVSPGGLTAYPAGLVGFWSGNDEGKDSAWTDDAVLTDITFDNGMDGQAFSFNGVTSSIKIPASREVDAGADDGFTLMAWIKPTDIQGLHPLFEWTTRGVLNDYSPHLFIGVQPFQSGILGGYIPDGGKNSILSSMPGTLTAGVFQHIAMTYDKASGMSALYVNGVMVAQKQLALGVTAKTEVDLWISPRDDRPGNSTTGRMFSGLMDNIALYNRALSGSEIQTVCAQENHGEPLAQPVPSSGWWELMND
jgi:Concanavalin A-like lectin/glucanases superfamily